MARKRKQSDPNRPARVTAARAEKVRLESLGYEVSFDQREGAITGARRVDVVTTMLRSRVLTAFEVDAVRRLEKMIEAASVSSASGIAGLNGTGSSLGVELRSELASLHRMAWAQQMADVERRMGRRTWRLIREVCDGRLIRDRWRREVLRQTGESNDKAQAAILREAIRDLADAFRAVDRGAPTQAYVA